MSPGAEPADPSDSSSEHIPADSIHRPSASPAVGGFSPHRFIERLISSAAHHIQGIDREPADLQYPTGMVSNVGQIKLRPDPATVLVPGMGEKHDIEAGDKQVDGAGHRPGLISQYLRLVHLDRKSTPLGSPALASGRAGKRAGGKQPPSILDRGDSQMDGDMWADMERGVSTATNSGSGLRRRKGRLRSAVHSWRPQSRGTTPRSPGTRHASGFFSSKARSTPSPISSPLAPGLPFRHLSEALPWASSQRLASASNTPLALTRRPSVSSITGDLSTMPETGIPGYSKKSVEQKNIVHAIDLLLLHQRFLILLAKALMVYGSPLHYLEDNLGRIARLLDLEVTVSAIPGLILLSFEDSVTHTSENKVIR
ncbi:hypothetical protein IWW57_006280, partial [Coemansia sp. S610]